MTDDREPFREARDLPTYLRQVCRCLYPDDPRCPVHGDLPIPEATIEAAAWALYEYRWKGDPTEGQFVGERFDLVEEDARVVLAAALPHLRSLQVETQVRAGYAIGRKEMAEEIADKFAHRAQLAQRVPEGERSGVREGMVTTWLAAEMLARDIGKGDSA